MAVSGVILAGGRGERLGGQDKAAVILAGRMLLEHVCERIAPLMDEMVLVLRPGQTPAALSQPPGCGVRVTHDLPGYSGVLAAMAAGLEAIENEWAFLVACDMPFVQLPLVRYMLAIRERWDIVVPRQEVGLEPLHALYHRRCLPALYEALRQNRRRVIHFYEGLRVRYIEPAEIARYDPQGLSIFNINTPEDLETAR
ncbi:MAG: molybdenum cofactor guanylyltransferase, partial [Chloroflexi bacterium]|nr:molybdenum cofactor guanylyltransferase [Chloroflexota bacterium]